MCYMALQYLNWSTFGFPLARHLPGPDEEGMEHRLQFHTSPVACTSNTVYWCFSCLGRMLSFLVSRGIYREPVANQLSLLFEEARGHMRQLREPWASSRAAVRRQWHHLTTGLGWFGAAARQEVASQGHPGLKIFHRFAGSAKQEVASQWAPRP